MEEEPSRRNHGGSIMEEESWRRNQGGGIMEEESWRRNHGGIMEEESWRRNHGGGIIKEESSWRDHLGALWGLPGGLAGHGEAKGQSDPTSCIFHWKLQVEMKKGTIPLQSGEGRCHQLL